jgi:hypothetical protein
VTLAAAHTLLQTNDKMGYAIYEAILAGEKHSKKGLLAGQMDTLKDPQNMALLGFQKGTALQAVAKRGGSSLANRIAPAMGDGKDAVKYTPLPLGCAWGTSGRKEQPARTAAELLHFATQVNSGTG